MSTNDQSYKYNLWGRNLQNFFRKICKNFVVSRCKFVSCKKVLLFDFYNVQYQTLIISSFTLYKLNILRLKVTKILRIVPKKF